MAGDCISLDAISDFAAKDVNRIVGKIAKVLARKSPFMDVLEGGTLPNVSDTVRSVVQERAVVAASLTAPVFTSDLSMCGAQGGQDQVGETEYSYSLATLRGRGPRVCVKTARTAFEGSYQQAQIALEKGILQIMNSDIRSTLALRSGVKFVARSDKTFSQLLSGDMQQIDTLYNNVGLPNAPMTFKALYKLGSFLREDMLAEPFGSEASFFKVIASVDQIEKFRNDLDVKPDLQYLTTGRYDLGERSLTGYSFEGPYRGFAFGIDSQPLRFNAESASGQPIFIEPEISVATSKGVGARRNPVWTGANYEVGFLIAGDSFHRLVPEKYTGEGTFRFAPQLAMGELEWTAFRDNDCNLYGDFGQHIYQIQRAYQPMRPQNVIPFIYARCGFDTGFASCASSTTGL